MASIVIVDDEVEILRVLVLLLSANGHKVTPFSNGNDAIAFMRQTPPDIVVSDMRMAPVDGLQILQAARSMDPPLPVIMVTAFTDEGTKRMALEQGASEYLAKPFNVRILMGAVDRVLSALAA